MGDIIKVIPEVTLDKYNVTLNQDVTEVDVIIEHQTREIKVFVQSFSGAFQNFYTKDEADARFMPIDYTPDWADIENKPSTFPPSAHTHPISQVIDLQDELDGKQPIGDYLVASDLTPLEDDIEALQGQVSTINTNLDNIESDITTINANISSINGELDNKVDKVAGKGLSTNDYTTTEKNKLAGIQAGAEVNVNADWSATTGDAQILNKPTLSEVAISGDYADLNNIPTEFTPAPHSHVIGDVDGLQTALDGKQPTGDYLVDADLDGIRTDIETIQGDITDIQADIVDINIDLGNKVDKITGKGLSTEDYTTAEKTKLSGIEEGAEVNVNADWNSTSGDSQILNKPTEFPPSAHTHAIADVIGLQDDLNDLHDNKADLVDGKVPASQLPSFVNDIIEVANFAALPTTGEAGIIYVTLNDNKTYRWGGTEYVEVSASLALGETSETAYRGDRGKTAYDHSQTTGNPHNTTKGDIGLGNVDNTSDANKPVSTATQTALDLKVDKVTGKGLSTEDYTTAEKSKLAGIEAGAEVNVNADWDAVSGDAQILNKPTNLSEFTNDLPIPTLDEVTDSGYYTDNYVEFGGVKAPLFDLDIYADTSTYTGRIKWNATDGTADIDLLNNVTLQVGQEEHIYGKAVGSIPNGSAVQFAGSQGDHILFKVAVASEINAHPEYFIGIATQTFANNDFGYITTFGKVRTLNTSSYSTGAVLYFNSTSGGLTTTKPSYPNAQIIVAAVVRSHATQGILMVRPHTLFYSDWNEISNKPSTFAPSAHTHPISQVVDLQTTLDGKEPTISAGTSSQYWRGDKTWQTLDKSAVGLGNVDNTSDLNKPISTATQTALNAKENSVTAGTTSQYYRGDKSWQTLDKTAVGLSNVVNLDTSNPANITQSASYRFVSDTEKATWNAKQNALTNPVTGTGSSGYHVKFTGSTTVGNSIIYDNGTNVGIGTTSPFTKMTIKSGYGGADGYGIDYTSGISGSRRWLISNDNQAYGDFVINTESTQGSATQTLNRFYISPSGNVGIGTTSPSYKLDINGASRIASGILNSDNSFEKVFSSGINFPNGTSNLAANLQLPNDAFWGYIEVEVTGTFENQSTSGKLTKTFAVGTIAGGTIFVNESRVSDAMGTIVNEIAIGDFAWNGTRYIIPISHRTAFGNSYTVKVKMFSHNGGAKLVFDNLSIGSNYTLTALDRQYVYYNSPIGIGTSTIATESNLNLGAFSTTEGGQMTFQKGTSQTYAAHLDNFTDRFRIMSGTNTSSVNEYFSVKLDNGYVGIGTTNPQYKLDVNGVIKAGNLASYALGTGTVYSTSGQLTNTNPSDERLKKEIEVYNYGLNEVLQLQPKTYFYKDDEDNKNQKFGFIAQEVREVMPELINEFDIEDERYLGLNTDGIYVALVNAIKELKAEIDILKLNQNTNSL